MIRRLFQVTVCSLTAVTSFRELSIPERSMAKQLTLLAIIKAKADQANELGRRLAALVAPTRAESGCINYDLHRSNDDPLFGCSTRTGVHRMISNNIFKRLTSKNSRQAATKYWPTIWIFGAFR